PTVPSNPRERSEVQKLSYVGAKLSSIIDECISHGHPAEPRRRSSRSVLLSDAMESGELLRATYTRADCVPCATSRLSTKLTLQRRRECNGSSMRMTTGAEWMSVLRYACAADSCKRAYH
ncbi:hypothetical protein BC834DRAFT_982502, partial [Gloeopeniophorella convolvens]